MPRPSPRLAPVAGPCSSSVVPSDEERVRGVAIEDRRWGRDSAGGLEKPRLQLLHPQHRHTLDGKGPPITIVPTRATDPAARRFAVERPALRTSRLPSVRLGRTYVCGTVIVTHEALNRSPLWTPTCGGVRQWTRTPLARAQSQLPNSSSASSTKRSYPHDHADVCACLRFVVPRIAQADVGPLSRERRTSIVRRTIARLPRPQGDRHG